MNEEQRKKETEELSKVVINNVIQSLFKDGTLKLSDLDNKEEFWKKLKKINEKADYKFVLDHTDSLIHSARQFNESNDFNKAKVFYATYFEHKLNEIINEICERKSIEKKEINNIIRSINLIGKLTWLPLLLGIPKISIKHKKVIQKLAEDRNAFIHYKHNPEPDEISLNEKEKQEKDLTEIEKTITYFKKYTSRILYSNQKTKINKKLKEKNIMK